MTRPTLFSIAPALALASCGARNDAGNQANGGPAVQNATLAKLDLLVRYAKQVLEDAETQ